jgi:hypothetical protein
MDEGRQKGGGGNMRRVKMCLVDEMQILISNGWQRL